MDTAARRRQARAVFLADAAARVAARAVALWWRRLHELLHDAAPLGAWGVRAATLVHFRRLPAAARGPLADSLTRIYDWGYRSARRDVLARVPTETLRRIAARRRPVAVPEDSRFLARFLRVSCARTAMYLQSDNDGSEQIHLFAPVPEDRRAAADPFDYLFGNGLTFPVLPTDIPRADLERLTLPVPPEHVIRRRVERLIAPFLAAPRPGLVPPERLADVVIQSYAQGRSIDEIEKDLLPHVELVRASARRVARTWGMHVANESQWEARERLGGDVVIGYRVMAELDSRTRPEHARRHGTAYYRNPKPGQKGFGEMPRPPHEADGSLAWNCRCALEPILAGA